MPGPYVQVADGSGAWAVIDVRALGAFLVVAGSVELEHATDARRSVGTTRNIERMASLMVLGNASKDPTRKVKILRS
jgi:hypothetical protein